MSWYPPPVNSTTGLTGIISVLNSSLDQMIGITGGNLGALSFLIPAWVIIFLPMSRFNPEAAFTTASFLCAIASMLLMALGMLNVMVFVIFFVMTLGGLISFYLHTRQ